MAQYRAEILRPDVPYGTAVNALAEMDDSELVMRLRPDMLAHHSILNHRAWQPEEPEHESLVDYLRHQVRADLLAAYFGEQDYVADSQLAFAYTRPYPTLIYLTPFNQDEDEVDDFSACNPVYRLICLGICKTPTEDSSFDMTGNVADGYDALPIEAVPTANGFDIQVGTGNITYVPVTTTSYATTSWATATAPRPVRRRTITADYVTPQDAAQEWLAAQADIERLQAHIAPRRPRMSDLDVVDELEPDTDDDMRF